MPFCCLKFPNLVLYFFKKQKSIVHDIKLLFTLPNSLHNMLYPQVTDGENISIINIKTSLLGFLKENIYRYLLHIMFSLLPHSAKAQLTPQVIQVRMPPICPICSRRYMIFFHYKVFRKHFWRLVTLL